MDHLRWLPLVIVAITSTPAVSFAQAPPSEIRVSGLTVAEAGLLRTEVARLAAERRVSIRALSAIAERLGAAQASPDIGELLRLIDRRAIDLRLLQDRLSSLERADDPSIAEFVGRAQAAIEQGDLAGADEFLAQAAQADLSAIAVSDARNLIRRRRAAETLSERGRVAELSDRSREAAQLYAQAADLLPESEQSTRWVYRMREAAALVTYGESRGDISDLRIAVETFQNRVLPLAPRELRPMDWAASQNNLGEALERLGERGDQTSLLRAVEAFELSLSIRTRENAPADWAATQSNLGVTLHALADRGDPRYLERAVHAFRSALLVRTQAGAPFEWAATQNNLGTVLLAQAWQGDTAAAGQAISAFQGVLSVYTRERDPQLWALTQNNLGAAWATLGQRGDDAALSLAADAYRLSLEIRTRERAPLDWAQTQNNLGLVLATLGERGDRAALDQAIGAFRASLSELTRQRSPLWWATEQYNLARALAFLATHGERQYLEEARVAADSAIAGFAEVGATQQEAQARQLRISLE